MRAALDAVPDQVAGLRVRRGALAGAAALSEPFGQRQGERVPVLLSAP